MATMWKNDKNFYEALKKTPLAQSKDESVEEVAVWIDLNGGVNTSSLIKIFKAIEENYHSIITDAIKDHSTTISLAHGASFAFTSLEYFSDRALYWLFKAISETNALDNAALTSKFMKYVTDAKNKHNNRITQASRWKWEKVTSVIDEDLYEVFAELEGILKRKCAL